MPPASRFPLPSSNTLRLLRPQPDVACEACRYHGAMILKAVNPLGSPRLVASTPPGSGQSRSLSTWARQFPPAKWSIGTPRSAASCTDQIKTATGRSLGILFQRRHNTDDYSRRRALKQRSWHEKLIEKMTGQPSSTTFGEFEEDADEFSTMFNARRLQTAKAALEPRLRCTEVDENGKVILVDGEFKKSELIAKVSLWYTLSWSMNLLLTWSAQYGLLPRDLRKIDSSNLPHILVRPASILINLLHLRVLIKSDRVLLFDIYGSKTSYPQSAFVYDLQGRLQQKQAPSAGGLPYEFRALEAVLMSVTTELESDFESVREPVIRILSELEEDITRDKLRILLILAKRVTTFEQKATLVRNAIEELLEADDDLASMYLTEKTHDLYRGEDDHTEVEMLLESYHKICDEVAQEAGNLVSGIRNTEEMYV
jgi:magnesium transporter